MSSAYRKHGHRYHRVLLGLLGSGVLAATVAASRPIAIDDLFALARVSDVQLSPDARAVAYTVTTPNVETNEAESNIWIVDTAGGQPRQMTHSGKDRAPRWSPDGKRLAFLSKEKDTEKQKGTSQVYLLTVESGDVRPVTRMASGADTVRWSPDGVTLIVTARVDPQCLNEECIGASSEARAANKGARVYDQWPPLTAIRWKDDLQSHLFAVSADGVGSSRDLTPGKVFDVPPPLTIDGSVDPDFISISPDGHEVCFRSGTGRESDGRIPSQLYTVSMTGAMPKRLSEGSANERDPAYSPDGRFIAYRVRLNPKDAGEQWRIMLHRRSSGETVQLAPGFDRSFSNLIWAGNSHSLYALAEEAFQQPLYMVSIDPKVTPRKLITGFVDQVSASPSRKAIAFLRSSLSSPPEIFISEGASRPRQITHHNDLNVSQLQMAAPESFWFESVDATPVQAMFVPPPQVREGHTYPLLVLLHGGPYTMWGNTWFYRWNPQVFAAPGYGVLLVNRRGSTGYGQKFAAAIVNDWGDGPFSDITAGIDATLARYPYLDETRIAAAGASYGGYLANWLATHTGRFKTIVSHAGVFNLTSVYAMDLPWFLEHEFKGTPWTAVQNYRQWSPSTYAEALSRFKTPMLVTVGEKDYRVPYMQSLELFAALQRQGVDSKLMVFPEEGHWILKPQDAHFWYRTLLDWLARYLQNTTAPVSSETAAP